jgi:hypothetical protein
MGILADILGPVGSLIGTNQTNQKNWDISQSNNDWSAQQYATRYQTTVADLTKAGLNPMLAYSNGPGNAPVSQQTAPMQNALGNAVESYNKTRGTSAQSALAEEQVKQAESQTTLNSANALKSHEEAIVAREQAENLRVDRQKRQVEIPQVQASTKAYEGQATASAAQAAQSYKMIENLTSQIQKMQEETKRIKNEGDINAPEAEFARKYPTTHLILNKFLPTISNTVRSLK